jgi:cell division protein FtsB
MNKLYILIIVFLTFIAAILFRSIFFGEKSYEIKNQLKSENEVQQRKNLELKQQNKILEFEINNAKNSNDHVENFARENLNLTYPDEEFIIFDEKQKTEDEKR